jgi:6-phosphofructokinase 1
MIMRRQDFAVQRLGDAVIGSPLKNVDFLNGASVVYENDPKKIIEEYEANGNILAFDKAGPRNKIFHDPKWSKAAILTAGGLCPGLNDVIKGLTITLKVDYKIPVVYGIPYGYEGLIPKFGHTPKLLDEDNVDNIHEAGGTVLGSSRGLQDEDEMVETLRRMNINLLFCIGGDGTLRCAHDIHKAIKKKNLNISVVGIPKTIDNDISFIDRTFGFETAVYATNTIITAAHNEARGANNGVGLIHIMGRDSGFIAAYATLANTYVNYCLVPEEKFTLHEEGSRSLLKSLKRRLASRKHAVIIVAEGAGLVFFEDPKKLKDKSGNVLKKNIGTFLKEEIVKWGKEEDIALSVKYFDPTYYIRSVPAHGTDAVYCQMLAQNAVHAAMNGCTDIVIGHWNNSFTHVPIPLATGRRKKIDINGELWNSIKAITWSKNDALK